MNDPTMLGLGVTAPDAAVLARTAGYRSALARAEGWARQQHRTVDRARPSR